MVTEVTELLGGERVLGKAVKSNLDLARATREGLPAESAIQLAESIVNSEALSADVKALAAWLFYISTGITPLGPMGAVIGSMAGGLQTGDSASTATTQSLGRLTPQESDVVVRTATVMARAIEVLGDKKKPVHWLTTANRALGGEILMTLLDTSAGTQELEATLDRVEYGLYG